jgi:hypothetical protein
MRKTKTPVLTIAHANKIHMLLRNHRQLKLSKNNVENMGTRQQFSVGNPEIELLLILIPKTSNFKNAHEPKKLNLLNKNSKIEKSENRRRKRGDASTIFSRKSKNVTFVAFVHFSGQRAKKKFA